jgi:hypothetical protein
MLFQVFLQNNSQNSKHLPQNIIFEQGTLFTSPKMGIDIMSLLNEFYSLDLSVEAKHFHTIMVEV